MLTDKDVYKFIKTVSDFHDFKLADTIFFTYFRFLEFIQF